MVRDEPAAGRPGPLELAKAAWSETSSSGSDVPKPTTTTPTAKADMPNRAASATASLICISLADRSYHERIHPDFWVVHLELAKT